MPAKRNIPMPATGRDVPLPSSSDTVVSRRGFLGKALAGAGLAGAGIWSVSAAIDGAHAGWGYGGSGPVYGYGGGYGYRPRYGYGYGRGYRRRGYGYGATPKHVAYYQDYPYGRQRCAGCVHFRPPGCEIVAGRISPHGWCRFYRGGGYRWGPRPGGGY